ncbi:putative endonuclease [Rubritalea squalenifaciens DSM 18772]|uniref:UPF0102 protein SAMN02745181_1387 n=1 Tax=Rubritalea squalenifaciens DSM 18772 TaxID=1123071 RepID=A0A1M6H7R3_9BACT|nr:YraN family protein [Rubritalea squalenifaciens]SHJ18133.1 putative endonuclease [Rubritalea squalenifaciens DSM 18772]
MTDRQGERIAPHEIGRMGEKMARLQLMKEGRRILYKNFRGPKGGEVDIVARDGEVLTFVEVKTRRRREGSRPLDAVTPAKQELIERGARAWLYMLKETDFLWRFDVVEVTLEEGKKPEVNVVKDFF